MTRKPGTYLLDLRSDQTGYSVHPYTYLDNNPGFGEPLPSSTTAGVQVIDSSGAATLKAGVYICFIANNLFIAQSWNKYT